MLKWILILAAVYMLYRMFESERRKKSAKAKQETQQLIATGELVKDPVCGAYVEAESAISARDGATVYHFCSYDCRDAFLRQRGVELPKGGAEDDDQKTE